MINKSFELNRLRSVFISRGLDKLVIDQLINKATSDIDREMQQRMDAALDQAIQAGIEKRSVDFISQVKPSPTAYTIETQSGNTDFSKPPFPMLPRLLQGGKAMKDGSGVYKVIPIGKPSTKPMSRSLTDIHKSIHTERVENAMAQYNKVAPKTSATVFRTASSKQNPQEKWVQPAKDEDFSEILRDINESLARDLDDIIIRVVREYEEEFG
jgi:hypothetical protein